MFQELPFLDRIDAAAKAGFAAVECQFPYAVKPAEIARRLQHSDLRWVLFNAPPGHADKGERGIASLPGLKATAGAVADGTDPTEVVTAPNWRTWATDQSSPSAICSSVPVSSQVSSPRFAVSYSAITRLKKRPRRCHRPRRRGLRLQP